MTARSTLVKQAAADAESTKAPAKKTTRKTVAKKAAPAAEKVLKKEQTFEQRDWTYLDEKDPSEQHVLLAKEINRRTNDIDIDPKQVQAVLAMFPHFQRSATNKSRSGYVALNEAIVEKRSEHMKLAHQEAREIMDGLQVEVAKKAAPAAKKVAAKAPAKKAAAPAKKTSVTKKTASPITGATVLAGAQAAAKKAPARKARVTKKAAAPAATEAF